MNKRHLIIGQSSIGKSHAEILTQLGVCVEFVSSYPLKAYRSYPTIESALQANHYDCAIIANATHLHYPALDALLHHDFQGVILVEKPLFSDMMVYDKRWNEKRIVIGYNMRFSTLIRELKQRLMNEEIVSFSAFSGCYLPTRRTGGDYRNLYSSQKDLGGGALRDLSHELDYTVWLCGEPKAITALGGQLSELEMSADDIYSILMQCERCPIVHVHLDYLNRNKRREINVQTKHHTYSVDLSNETLSIDGKLHRHEPGDINQTLIREHQAILNEDMESFCSFQEGLHILGLISSIEQARQTQTWLRSD